MLPIEPPSVSVSRRGHRCFGGDPLRTVVWVRGEHDIATRGHLSATIAQAVRVDDDADVVVDLSGVTFMDASTIGALVIARDDLEARSHSLMVRAPSPPARRLLTICDLAGMIDAHVTPPRPAAAAALSSWIDVPACDRGSDSAQQVVAQEARSREPARVAARRSAEPAVSVQQRRAPS